MTPLSNFLLAGYGGLLLSAVLLAWSMWLERRVARRPASAVIRAGLLLSWCVLSIGFAVAHRFTAEGVNAAVVFHLRQGLAGAGYAEYTDIIVGAAIAMALASAWVLWSVFARGRARTAHPRHPWRAFAAIAVLATAVLFHPTVLGWARAEGLLLRQHVDATRFRHLDAPHLARAAPGALPHLVVIHAEALEATYFDESVFPGLMPRLTALQEEADRFADIRQIDGIGFTMGGLVASHCGVPLSMHADGNSLSAMDQYLPGATCLGDLLKAQGYALHFMGGARLEFAGKGQFFRTHGFDVVEGLDELLPRVDDPEYVSAWGLYDDTLVELLQARFEELSEEDRPFGLFALTVDTHHPRGHLSRRCEGVRYGDGSNPMLNAVHCTDRLLAELVTRLRAANQRDTWVVVASDHLAMENTASPMLRPLPRRNLVLMFPPAGHSPLLNGRPGSLLDFAPTLLSRMGLDVPHLGYGRDLAQPPPSYVEALGEGGDFFFTQRPLLRSLWSYPVLDFGMHVDARRRRVRFGPRTMDVPTLLAFDDTSNVAYAMFDNQWPERLPGYLGKLQPGRRFALIDHCAAAEDLGLQREFGGESCSDLCLFAGRKGESFASPIPVCDELFLAREDLAALFDAPGGETGSGPGQDTRLQTVFRWGASHAYRAFESPADMPLTWELRSAGYGAGWSYVQPVQPTPALSEQAQTLQRGFSVFRWTESAAPELVSSFDACTAGPDTEPSAALWSRMAESKAMWAIVVHDTAFCTKSDPLSRLFEGSGLERVSELEFRQPYVAVRGPDGAIKEFVGTRERALIVHL